MATQHKKLEKLIERIKEINHIIPNLNRGGCGIMAHAIGKALQLNGFRPRVVSIGYFNCDNPDKFVEDFKNSNSKEEFTATNLHRKGAYINHLMVEVTDEHGEPRYIDSTGVYKEPYGYGEIIEMRMSVEDCGIMASNPNGWNKSFDRNFIPKIYSFINNHLLLY